MALGVREHGKPPCLLLFATGVNIEIDCGFSSPRVLVAEVSDIKNNHIKEDNLKGIPK
jgi:hypothetical protein